MRYWLMIADRRIGPFSAEALVRTKGFTPESLVCREDKPVKNRRNWKTARRVDEVARLLPHVELRPVSVAPSMPELFVAKSPTDDPIVPDAGPQTDPRPRKQRAPAAGAATPVLPRRGAWPFILTMGTLVAATSFLLVRGFRTDQASKQPKVWDAGRTVDGRTAAEIEDTLRVFLLATRGKTLEQEMGLKSVWRVRQLGSGLYRVDILGTSSHPLSGERYACRLTYDPRDGSLRAENALAEFLLGTREPIALKP